MEKLLNHRRNKLISFNKENHTYTHKQYGKLQGITGFLGTFFSPFDKEKVSKKVAYLRGVSQEDILQEWEDARAYGDWVHEHIENYYNDGVYADEAAHIYNHFNQELDFYGIKPLICEYTIYSDRLRRASSVDFIGVKDNKLVVMDIKTMEKDITSEAHRNKKCSSPIKHLQDAKYQKHCLQVNMYKNWLEEEYGLPVHDDSYIIQYHDNREEKIEFIPVMDMKKEINDLINYK